MGRSSRRKQDANRFVWNLRGTPVEPLVDDPKANESETRKTLEGLAPRALAGEYEARLRVGEATVSPALHHCPR